MGALMAIVFRSPYALMIAALGPVMAVGSWWEARRSHRATSAEQLREQESERERHEHNSARADRDYRREQLARFPAVGEWVTNPLWRPLGETPPQVRVGLDSVVRRESSSSPGRYVSGVPLTVELAGGIAVVGRGTRATHCYRAIVVQVAALMLTREIDGSEIPHEWELADPPRTLRWGGSEAVTLQLVEHADAVEGAVRSVLTVSDYGAAVFIDGRRRDAHIAPDELSAAQALWAGRRLAQWRSESGSCGTVSPDFADRRALWARVDREHWHDMVAEGPHALVWGQSGRGKTLLLQSLLREIAANYSPERFSCVVIDFKGGSGVLAIDDLPHLAGVLTDLDAASIQRVHVGLRSEILRREHLLADHRVSDLSDLPAEVICPRTLIVVDEIALLLESDPGWSALLGDIASRGRSLGLHLVISGQRITSQVPRSVVANAGIRWCLGVTDPAEALEYLPGVNQVTLQSLHQYPPGQVLGLALGRPSYLTRVERRAQPVDEAPAAPPLWAPALPESLEAEGRVLGVAEDQPGQCLRRVSFDDLGAGMVLVVGDPQSGLCDVVSRITECAPASLWLSEQPAECLDHMGSLAEALDAREDVPACVVTPRLDVLLSSAPESAQAALITAVTRLARAAEESNTAVLVSSGPGGAVLRRLATAASSLIALSMRSVDHWLELDLPRDRWLQRGPAGRGLWGGQAIQFARAVDTRPGAHALPPMVERPCWTELISRGERLVVVGDDLPSAVLCTDSASVTILSTQQATLRRDEIDQAVASGGVLLWGVGLGAARAIVGHERTPHLHPPEGTCWWVGPHRARLVSIEA